MGKMLRELVLEKQNDYNNRIILVKVDGKLQEINNDIEITDETVEFITTDTSIGNDTYRRSLCMLMQTAISKLTSRNQIQSVCVEFSVSKGYFCDIKGNFEVTDEFIKAVKEKMMEYVSADIPITKRSIKTKEAIKLFGDSNMTDKKKLFRYRTSSYVNIYSIDGYDDYYYGYMAPSTGVLKYFDLIKFDDGFVLQMPVKELPDEVPEFKPQIKVFNALKESTKWADELNLHSVGAINDNIVNGNINRLILVQEAKQEQKIIEIVDMIKRRKGIKFIMIAGPSSSGKTTFSHRLSIQLCANGFKPHPICVDDYFVEREQTPLDENGNYNFEDIEAIDVELFNKHMNMLLAGEEVDMPTFNFKLGKKEYNGNKLKLGEDDILVIEGIHCLNDKLSYSLPVDSKFKIYISALTQLNVDEHNRVATTDGRLFRRMARDARTRGASAKKTLSMWDSVRKGEEKNIFPYQEEADVVFNSSTAYEISVLKPIVEPLLYSIDESDPEYLEAKRLLKFINYFLPCDLENVPINSIVREFTGGGCFKI